MDSYLPALIESPLYFPDGQIQDEVYVWGSFRMSRMHAAGVVCSDCHEPHGLSLRAEGNGVCGQCHAPAVFDSASHHRHEAGNPGSACVDCHMPARTYMVVDPRRDHGFRVPRPDLADSLDVPDACRSCHADRPAGWTAARVREWLGRDAAGSQRFAETLHAADTWAPDAPGALRALAADEGQPAIARASALARLSRWPGRATEAAARDGLAHADALLRLGAVRAVASAPGDGGRRLLSGALGDPVKAVRLEAAVALSRAGLAALDPALRSRLAPVLEEYVALQEAFLDRPEARTNLGNLYAAAGEPAVAERRYREALSLQRDFEAAWVNLADLYRAQGRQSEAREVLERAAAIVPASAAVQHSLGLAAVRAGERGLALERLERAVELDPANGRYAWVYAVALDDAGRGGEAVATLEEALARRPADPQLLEGMVSLLMKAGRHGDALVHARRLATLRPDDAQLAALLRELSRD
jgi:Flp pilus assembly protein TadD